jgi:hypothetical protein
VNENQEPQSDLFLWKTTSEMNWELLLAERSTPCLLLSMSIVANDNLNGTRAFVQWQKGNQENRRTSAIGFDGTRVAGWDVNSTSKYVKLTSYP